MVELEICFIMYAHVQTHFRVWMNPFYASMAFLQPYILGPTTGEAPAMGKLTVCCWL